MSLPNNIRSGSVGVFAVSISIRGKNVGTSCAPSNTVAPLPSLSHHALLYVEGTVSPPVLSGRPLPSTGSSPVPHFLQRGEARRQRRRRKGPLEASRGGAREDYVERERSLDADDLHGAFVAARDSLRLCSQALAASSSKRRKEKRHGVRSPCSVQGC